MDLSDIKANLSKEDLIKRLLKKIQSANKEDIIKMLAVEGTSTEEITTTANEAKKESQPSTSYASNENINEQSFPPYTQQKSKKTYDVRSGTVNSGREYEYKMITLLCIRCILKNPENMWIATNAKGVGEFDDIICYFKTKGSPGITYMVQMKHAELQTEIKEEDFTHRVKPFNLIKHAQGFSKLKETLVNSTTSDDVIENLDPNKIVSLFFTNRIAANSGLPYFKGCTSEDLMLLNTNVQHKHLYKFDFTAGSALGLTNQDYCENIYFLSNQNNETNMDVCIFAEMEKLIKQLDLAKIGAHNITKDFTAYVTNRAKGKSQKREYLTQQQILYKLAELLLSRYAVKFNNELGAFHNCPNKKIWKKIVDDKQVIYVTFDEVTIKYLKDYVSSEVKNYENQKSIFYKHSNFETILGKQGTPIISDVYKCMWIDNKVPLLLEINNEEEHQSVLSILNWSKLDLKIVIVNKLKLALPIWLDTKATFVNLNDLNEEQRRLILDKSISLQGRKAHKLGKLIDKSMYDFITCNDIIHILTGSYNIGNSYTSVRHFIERSLYKILIKFEALKEIKDETFIIHDQAPEGLLVNILQDLNLNYNTPNIIVSRNIRQDDIEELKSKYKTIHRLIFCGANSLEWMESQGGTKRIKEHLDRNDSNSTIHFHDKIRNDILTNILNKTHVFSGCPGMGKSTLIDFISKEAPSNMWVLKITLSEHTEHFETVQFEKASDYIKYFNEKIINDGSCFNIPLAEAVFQKLSAENEILLLLDGFDEVSVSCKNETTRIIQSLHESGYHIWISTRPHMNSHLEKEFDTIAITIMPFTLQDKQHFFIKYFTEFIQNSKMYQRHIKKFTQKLLNAAEKNLNDWDREFMEIPLQCKLLADFFTDDLKSSLSENVKSSIEDFNLLQLYEHFMNKKRNILCNRYGKYAKEMHTFFDYYQKLLALKVLFRKSDLCELSIDLELNDYYRNKKNCMEFLQREGVLVVHKEKQTFSATFVHRTFAEFIAAQWLAENYDSTNSKIKNTIDFLLSRRLRYIYGLKFLFRIFDSLFAKGFPLHSAIINKQIPQVKKMLANSPEDINKLDKCKRSILHLIALYFVDQMIDIIELMPVGQVIKLCAKDSFEHNPLDYAILRDCQAISDKLCKKSNEIMITIDISKHRLLLNGEFALNPKVHCLLWKCIKKKLSNLSNFIPESEHDIIISQEVKYLKTLNIITTTDLMEKFNIKSMSENYYFDLRVAVALGTVDNVKQLIAEGADVNLRVFGRTPLYCAVRKDRWKIVEILLSEMAEINTTCLKGNTALHAASKTGYRSLVQALIKNGANVNKRNVFGKTPLYYASKNNQVDIVNLLLQHGADVNIINNECNTCLHVAAKNGFYNFTHKFIQYGTEVNISNVYGKTPLFLALENRQTNIANLLIKEDIKVDIMDPRGNTYLHAAAKASEIDIIRLLIEKGLDINKQNEYGETPLLCALQSGHRNAAQFLLANKAKADCLDVRNNSCLHYAAKLGEIGIVQHITNEDFNINLENNKGETPLSLAVKNGHISAIELLLKNNAEIDKVDSYGDTYLHAAAKVNQSHIMRQLINAGLDVNKQNHFGETPLLIALGHGYLDVAKVLTSCGADLNLRTKINNCHLQCATRGACLEDWIQFLHMNKYTNDEECDFTVINSKNQTLLHVSVYKIPAYITSFAKLQHHERTVKFLLSSGIDVNKKDNRKRTVLHYICDYCSFEDDFYENIATLILNTDIDINANDVRGKTALDLVTERNPEIASLIQQRLTNSQECSSTKDAFKISGGASKI